MDNAEYTTEMNRVMVAVHLLSESPIDELVEIVSKVEVLGPLLEPTAYQRGGARRLDEQRRLLAAAVALVRVFRQIERENTEAGAAHGR